MAALARPGKHRDIPFIVTLHTEPGRRMRWTFVTDSGLTESGVTSYGIEAAFKAGIDAVQGAIDIPANGKATPGKGRKMSANDGNWTAYGAAVDALKNAIAAWARDSSSDNLAMMEKAQALADAEAKVFYQTIGR